MVKKAIIIILILFLIFSLFFLLYFWQKQMSSSTRASVSGEPSLENSYLFASPLYASAGGEEKIRVTIFILDSQGLGVSGQSVALGENAKLLIRSVQDMTDAYGKAVFEASSSVPGEYIVEAKVGNRTLPQSLHISFR